ncbi:MAG: hypothetical protein JKY94_17405 [Rhodobacteraceae bacterium]|nr:hypothetical protein [Paracoccaceae bacterium]
MSDPQSDDFHRAAMCDSIEKFKEGQIARFNDGGMPYSRGRLCLYSDLEAAVAAARIEEREAIAKEVEAFNPGLTADELSGHLVPDKDGPWGMNVQFANRIRNRKL